MSLRDSHHYFKRWDIRREGSGSYFVIAPTGEIILSWDGEKVVQDSASTKRPFCEVLSKKEKLLVANELENEMRKRLMLPPKVEDDPEPVVPYYKNPAIAGTFLIGFVLFIAIIFGVVL